MECYSVGITQVPGGKSFRLKKKKKSESKFEEESMLLCIYLDARCTCC